MTENSRLKTASITLASKEGFEKTLAERERRRFLTIERLCDVSFY